MEPIRVLSIDAWRDRSGWYWNDHRKVGEIDSHTLYSLNTNRKLLGWLRRSGFLTDYSKGRVRVDAPGCYDGVFIEIQDRHTGRPLFAISSIH